MGQNNSFTRSSHPLFIFVHFFAVVFKTTKTWNSQILDPIENAIILQREARYRFHQTKIFDTFLTLFDWGTGFFREFEIYARKRLEITATFLNNHRMNFPEIREKSWSGGNGSALRAVSSVHPTFILREMPRLCRVKKLRRPVRAFICTNVIFLVQTLFPRTNFLFLVQTLFSLYKVYFPRTKFIIIVQTLLALYKL